MNDVMIIGAGENLNFAGIEVLDCNDSLSTKVTRLGKVYVQKECTGLAKAPGFIPGYDVESCTHGYRGNLFFRFI